MKKSIKLNVSSLERSRKSTKLYTDHEKQERHRSKRVNITPNPTEKGIL